MNYRCVEIPEPDFDASFTDEMVVTAYQDEEDFNPCMPDEYPNIRLAELEKKIDETTLQASEAYEAASNASDISELAKTTASAAVTEIVEHEATITNPHPANTTQDFAAVNISGLKSDLNGGSVSAADYDWFKGVYSSLIDGSVISWIKGLVNQVKLLTNRVGLLEDNYILKYVVPVDTTAINLTQDRYGNNFNFSEGDEIQVTFSISAWVDISTNLARISFRLNNLSSSIYYVQNNIARSGAVTAGNDYKTQRTRIVFTINKKEIIGLITNQSITSADARVTELYPFYTNGLDSITVSSIQLILSTSNARIPSGTVILVKKL